MQAVGKVVPNGTATVTTKGQVTIPSDVRKAMNINEGDQLFFEVDSDSVRIRKLTPLDFLVDVIGPKLREAFPTPEDFDNYLRANRKEILERIYRDHDVTDSN